MKRIIIICEGQTERDFCQKVLAPYLWQYGITIQTPLIKISGGGIVKWDYLRKQAETHLLPLLIIMGFMRNIIFQNGKKVIKSMTKIVEFCF